MSDISGIDESRLNLSIHNPRLWHSVKIDSSGKIKADRGEIEWKMGG
jgi:hypothetical protein